jgi:hypothetical protein
VESRFISSEVGDERNSPDYVFTQGFISSNGKKKILLVNKRDRVVDIAFPDGKDAQVEYVDQTTGFDPPRKAVMQRDHVPLPGLAVAVVTPSR